jgi:hypothetical protein
MEELERETAALKRELQSVAPTASGERLLCFVSRESSDSSMKLLERVSIY